jgi:phosphoserine aminotransferase
MSLIEMSHRSKEYDAVHTEGLANFREVLSVPDTHDILFIQGGASLQFCMIPMNLGLEGRPVDYINTGTWSTKAIKEARIQGKDVKVIASSEDENYSYIPKDFSVDENAAYLHFTSNNTIKGTQWTRFPNSGDVPLVSDMSSDIMSRAFDPESFGLIYAGAQKNIGPSGLTIVIIREDLIGNPADGIPTMFNYATHADAGSMYNTPPTYGWYLAGLVFQWLKRNGGLAAMAETNERKASKLYAAIDNSGFYANPVDNSSRSWMNVPFTLADADLDATFLEEAKGAGLVTLKGHRSVGGMRASIYNAMPEEGVDALIDFMTDFEKRNG